MSIVGLDPPDFRTVSDFRKRHLKALARLFAQVLKLCEQAGLVKLGYVALDGAKIKANASKHKAMSYDRMEKRAAELEAEVQRRLSAAEAADAEEDKAFGANKSGEELPDWVRPSSANPGRHGAPPPSCPSPARAARGEGTPAIGSPSPSPTNGCVNRVATDLRAGARIAVSRLATPDRGPPRA
jgi:hypothetical protein